MLVYPGLNSFPYINVMRPASNNFVYSVVVELLVKILEMMRTVIPSHFILVHFLLNCKL